MRCNCKRIKCYVNDLQEFDKFISKKKLEMKMYKLKDKKSKYIKIN